MIAQKAAIIHLIIYIILNNASNFNNYLILFCKKL